LKKRKKGRQYLNTNNKKAEQTNVIQRGGEVYSRLDIDKFLENKEQQDLLIQAWQSLYDRHWSDPLGFWQISGMHANPIAPYDGVANATLGISWTKYEGKSHPVTGNLSYDCSKTSRAFGYCGHNSALFLTWHRAQTILFEQRLSQEAQAIAENYPRKYRRAYKQAAKELRIPVFDFGGFEASQSGFPPILSDEFVTLNVDVSGATGVTVKNPLAHYEFPITTGLDVRGSGLKYTDANRHPLIYAKGDRSIRYPTAGDSQVGDHDAAQGGLKVILNVLSVHSPNSRTLSHFYSPLLFCVFFAE
jgi:hypothetical protein